MPKPNYIELTDGKLIERLPIVYEDRSVIAIDKPAGWMLVPFSWQRTARNLQAAISSSVAAGEFWARSRNLKFLRHVHRLDAETSGVLLFAKSMGAVKTYGDLFESRQMEKVYFAVVQGEPKQAEWTCRLKLGPDPKRNGRVRVDPKEGKECETHFKLLRKREGTALIEVHPVTGRTHQIRVHLQAAKLPIVGDELYGDRKRDGTRSESTELFPLGLRAVALSYRDPFLRKPVNIHAPREEFLRAFGFVPD